MRDRRGLSVILLAAVLVWTASLFAEGSAAALPIGEAAAAPDAPTTTASAEPDSSETAVWFYRDYLRPVFDAPALLWFGGVLWLALALDLRRFWSLQTIDVLAILTLGVLFELRNDGQRFHLGRVELTYANAAWTGMYLLCAYLFLRSIGRVLWREPRPVPPPGIGASAWILFAFVVSMNLCTMVVPDVGKGGMDAIAGGDYLKATGELPYGTNLTPRAQGPVMYALHAAVQHAEPDEGSTNFSAPSRWIASIAHTALLVGILMLGWQRHSPEMGALLAALYGLISPVVFQIAAVSATLPAALVVWALVVAAPQAKAVGGILAGALLALAAGVAFYPALLAPAWVGYFLRRRAAAATESPPPPSDDAPAPRRRDFGALAFALAFVLVAGVIVAYTIRLTRPRPPRTDAVLALLDEPAFGWTHELRLVGDTWTLTPLTSGAETQPTAHSGSREPARSAESIAMRAARCLADDGCSAEPASLSRDLLSQITDDTVRQAHLAAPLPADLAPSTPVPLRRIRAGDPDAGRVLALLYRESLPSYSRLRRAVAALRTVAESTGAFPSADADAGIEAPHAPPAGAWDHWRQYERDQLDGVEKSLSAQVSVADRIRRIDEVHRYVAFGTLGLPIVLFLGFLLFKSRCTIWHLAAASAAVLLAVQLCKSDGVAAHPAWYLPFVVVSLFAGRVAPARD